LSARRRTPERTVVLSLGSNLGRREDLLLGGVGSLARSGALRLDALSSLYETSPVGIATNRLFVNAVLVARSALSAAELLAACRAAEREAGRPAGGASRDRTLDVDIVFYGDEVIDEPGLAIPHPRHAERLFVLVPLAEISPSFRVPPSGKGIADLLGACRTDAWVRKVSGRRSIR
jgi:2-amino-4-hydroxy-6-hydroxymethyldihydropteridine diphosphokinase